MITEHARVVLLHPSLHALESACRRRRRQAIIFSCPLPTDIDVQTNERVICFRSSSNGLFVLLD